ncbi:MAG: prepilin-type N-terminal cleavage/methylation domain-containing protein [Candidatus Eremiobacterota bacterium]
MSRPRGMTLIELMVYAMLLSVALATIFLFFKYGNVYLHKTRTMVAVEQQSNVATAWLMKDLMECPEGLIDSFASPPGVVFLSARDNNGNFVYDTNTGDPIWQRYVGYYLDVDPERPNDTRVNALFRAEQVVGGLPATNAQRPTPAGVTTTTMRTSGINRRLVAHGLVPPTGGNHGGLDVYSLPDPAQPANKQYDALFNPLYLDLEFRNTSAGSSESSIQTRLRIQARS